MKLFGRRFRRDEAGAAAVEFAIVGPVAIMLILGTIECGRVMFMLNDMQASLSAAARAWMIDPEASNGHVTGVFCARTTLANCDQTTITFASETLDGQDWRIMTVTTPFDSPLSHLLPFPTELTRSRRVPIYES